jgi:2-polyprenyl-6-methoxyphenol hydroxylase-like FAD-dependent oxidoreductase
MAEFDTDVLVVGAGPCGLTLANELGRRGVRALVVDSKSTTAVNPQANATQARTMEHYRRLGFADEVRRLGLPVDYPTDIAYFTRFCTQEIARFSLPAAKDATQIVRGLSGSWSAAELPHRVSQKFVEPVLLKHARALPGIEVRFDARLVGFREGPDHVEADVDSAQGLRTLRARYLVGADGARSFVRQAFGWGWVGDTRTERAFMGGRMLAVYVRAKDYYRLSPNKPAWMYVAFNPTHRAYMAAVDGRGEFAFHAQLAPGDDESRYGPQDGAAFFRHASGLDMDVEVLSMNGWTAGHALVAERMHQGRVAIGGDAAHLFTPAGGMGYNTGVEDAVNLGWKLAACVRGIAGPNLLASYEAERWAVARRNTGFARALADSLGKLQAPANVEDETPEGAAARAQAGAYFNRHAREEFNIPGFTLGARYDGSPVIVSDGAAPPPDGPNVYHPSACPGGRAPHVWLADGRSLYDSFGFEWTLLVTRDNAQGAEAFAAAARARGMELKVLRETGAGLRDLYEADLALVRPDQVVAWRGADGAAAQAVVDRALGF